MKNIKNQKGMATLIATAMLLLIMSLNVFIGSKGSVIEQQSANNQYRTEEAIQNAESGVEQLISNLKAYILNNPSASTLADTTITDPDGKFVATFNSATSTIISKGNGSGNATRTVSQRVKLAAGSGGGPAALNALGSISLGGNVSATDVQAGGAVTTTGSGSVQTAGGGNSENFKVTLLDHSGNALLDSSGNVVKRSMTTEEYFMYFFGGLCPNAKAAGNADGCKSEAKAAIQDSHNNNTNLPSSTRKGYYCATSCDNLNQSELAAAYTAGKRVFWLEAGLNHKFTLGTVDDPVIVLVMNVVNGGDAVHINANSTLNGVLYVDVLDQKTSIYCSCKTDATVVSIESTPSYIDDTSKKIYTPSASGVKCNTNGGCTDSLGTTIAKNSHYTLSYQKKINGYNSTPSYGRYSNTALNPSQPAMCTVNACTTAQSTATLSCTGGTSVGSAGTCSYIAPAVSGTNNTQVEISITGTWDNSGGGNAVIYGAAITSGGFTGEGTLAFIRSSSAIANSVLTGVTGSGFDTAPRALTKDPQGWTDAN
jgi:hypothetical protein